MTAVWQEDGLTAAADALAALAHDGGGAAEWVVHLFKNNHTPALGDDVADYTEADFSSYVPLPIGAFGAAVFAVDRATALALAALSWTNSTGVVGNSIYGAFITNAAGTEMRFAERAPAAPIDMTTAGKTMSYTPAIGDKNP